MATKKVRMNVSRGNPSGGAVIRAGATVELPEFWADKFIADGSAVLVEETETRTAKDLPKNGKTKK